MIEASHSYRYVYDESLWKAFFETVMALKPTDIEVISTVISTEKLVIKRWNHVTYWFKLI